MSATAIFTSATLLGAAIALVLLYRAFRAEERGELWFGNRPTDTARPAAGAVVLLAVATGLDKAGIVDVSGTMSLLRDVLHTRLIAMAGVDITPIGVITVVVVVSLASAASSAFQAAISRRAALEDSHTASKLAAIQRLAHYAIMGLGVLAGLQAAGVDLSALLAASAVFAVGIGFGLQTVAKNFVSGLTLLIERTIKPGDTLEIGDRLVQVVELGIRATVVRTTDNEEIIVPNGMLMDGPVTNHTLHDPVVRVRARVGVAYGSDPTTVQRALTAAGESLTGRVAALPPVVLFTDFGQSAMEFEVSVWTDAPFERDSLRSHLRIAMLRELGSAGVDVAFPQLDVRLWDQRKGAAVAPRHESGEKP